MKSLSFGQRSHPIEFWQVIYELDQLNPITTICVDYKIGEILNGVEDENKIYAAIAINK